MYNRTPAYDNIVERMRKHEESVDGITLSTSAETAGLRQRKAMSRETSNSSPQKDEVTDEETTTDGEPGVDNEEADDQEIRIRRTPTTTALDG